MPVIVTQCTRLPTPLTKSIPEVIMTFMKMPNVPRIRDSTDSVT